MTNKAADEPEGGMIPVYSKKDQQILDDMNQMYRDYCDMLAKQIKDHFKDLISSRATETMAREMYFNDPHLITLGKHMSTIYSTMTPVSYRAPSNPITPTEPEEV